MQICPADLFIQQTFATLLYAGKCAGFHNGEEDTISVIQQT